MFKLFSKDSLHAQLEAERKAMENQQRQEAEQAAQAEAQRSAAARLATEQTERAALDAVIAAATAAVDAFEHAAQAAMIAEERVYTTLFKDNCQLEQRLPAAAFERERRMTLAKLRARVQQILQRSQYEPTYMIGGGNALSIPATAARTMPAPPATEYKFNGLRYGTNEPIHSNE